MMNSSDQILPGEFPTTNRPEEYLPGEYPLNLRAIGTRLKKVFYQNGKQKKSN